MKARGAVVTGHLLALPSQGTKPTGAGTNGPGRRSVFLGCKTKHGQRLGDSLTPDPDLGAPWSDGTISD
ncbi:unnamed protein product [Gadus morhua 'NCC']